MQARPEGQNCLLSAAGAIDLSVLLHQTQETERSQANCFLPKMEIPAQISQANKPLCFKLLGGKNHLEESGATQGLFVCFPTAPLLVPTSQSPWLLCRWRPAFLYHSMNEAWLSGCHMI